jgi:endonuclease YncB( thermonuclease family)
MGMLTLRQGRIDGPRATPVVRCYGSPLPSQRPQPQRQPARPAAPADAAHGITLFADMHAIAAIALAFATLATPARSEPFPSGAVQVVDGDTIRVRGQTVRFVGFATPEAGSSARCEGERNLAARAASRLRALVAGGGLDLQIVRCSCKLGTEGTQRCNYGRACGVLKARGRDVGTTLITEGLARPYVCGPTSCPPRAPWC